MFERQYGVNYLWKEVKKKKRKRIRILAHKCMFLLASFVVLHKKISNIATEN